jgi:hypothetical protein
VKAPNKQKNNEKSFWVFFLMLHTTKQERNTENKREIFLGFLKFF